MAGAAVTFLSVTLAHVILCLRVAREIIGERERANLVVSTADFSLYIYIYIFRALDATIP